MILSGDGADELFAGYRWYEDAPAARGSGWRRLARRLQGAPADLMASHLGKVSPLGRRRRLGSPGRGPRLRSAPAPAPLRPADGAAGDAPPARRSPHLPRRRRAAQGRSREHGLRRRGARALPRSRAGRAGLLDRQPRALRGGRAQGAAETSRRDLAAGRRSSPAARRASASRSTTGFARLSPSPLAACSPTACWSRDRC